MSYRVELATTKRALCKNKECKDQQIKIDKGELRLGVWVSFGEHQSWAWRHWGCVTPTQLAGIKDALEGDMEMFDGYEELPDDLKEKVKSAVEAGHVNDDDWRGDVEQNRPGKRGFRSPAAKKKKQKENQEENADEQGDQSPSQSKPKKRARTKKEPSAEDDLEEPARKKAKATTKKATKIKNEDEDGGDAMAVDEPVETNGSGKVAAKKGRKAKGEEGELGAASKQKERKPASRAKKIKDETLDDGDHIPEVTPKKSKAANKRSKKAVKEEGAVSEFSGAEAQDNEEKEQSNKIKDEDEGNDALSEFDDHSTKTTRKARTPKNAANTKKAMTKKTGKGAQTDPVDTSAVEATKVRKGRKKGGSAKTKNT
ncbi:MAG: hypothetical protein Q9220_000242 [cf. Caloplaca sp. 1 TL-2023]